MAISMDDVNKHIASYQHGNCGICEGDLKGKCCIVIYTENDNMHNPNISDPLHICSIKCLDKADNQNKLPNKELYLCNKHGSLTECRVWAAGQNSRIFSEFMNSDLDKKIVKLKKKILSSG